MVRGTKQSHEIRDCRALLARNDDGNVKILNAFVLVRSYELGKNFFLPAAGPGDGGVPDCLLVRPLVKTGFDYTDIIK